VCVHYRIHNIYICIDIYIYIYIAGAASVTCLHAYVSIRQHTSAYVSIKNSNKAAHQRHTRRPVHAASVKAL
jgi:hypothetical protein